MPAKPFGANLLVEPWITSRKMNVITTSAMNADVNENEVNWFAPKPEIARLNDGLP